MSFRQYGGINYAARNNIVKNNYSNANNLSVMTKVGQPSSYINFESDISANIIYSDYLNVNNLTVNYNSTLKGNLDVSGNSTLKGTLTVGPTNGPNGIMYIIDNITAPKATLRIIAANFDEANFIQSGINKTSASAADLRFTDMNAINTWMTIKKDGKVGIGTTVPNGKLDVRGNMYIKPTVTTSISSPAFKIELDGANCIIYKSTTSSSDTVIQNNGGGSLKLMSDNGDGVYISGISPFVGINNTSPASALDVNGDALINGLTVGRGNGNLVGNTAVGYNALKSNTLTDSYNTAIGYQSLFSDVSGNLNTAIGYETLYNTTKHSNTGIGLRALYCNTTGFENVAIGKKALFCSSSASTASTTGNGTGTYNVAVGNFSLYMCQAANNNTAVGYSALYSNTNTSDNTAVGYFSLKNNNGNYNTAVGSGSLQTNSTGTNNTAMGYYSLYTNSTGTNNTAVGSYSLQANSTGTNNTAMGYYSMYNNTSSTNNTAFGTNSLCNQKESGIANGPGATTWQSTYGNNTAIGGDALYWTSGVVTDPSGNKSGSWNTAVGLNALRYNTQGYYNTAVGIQAGVYFTGSQTKTTADGGPNTANRCTFLGAESRCSVGLIPTNSTAIGYDSVITASNQIILGNSSITSLQCNALLSGLSDARDKMNFVPLDAGLNFINVLNPIRFDWNQRGGGLEGRKDIGFTAQELLSAQEKTKIPIPNLVDESNPDKYYVMYTQLIPILVKAVQEMSSTITRLEAEINELKLKI